MDHPTRGLDIGAKEDVYDMIREMCDDGAGVVLVADTLEEAIAYLTVFWFSKMESPRNSSKANLAISRRFMILYTI